jgi:proteasome lid subunit RPN8/RPN11
MPAGLAFTIEHLSQITAHLESCLPEEACGLVGGLGEQARLILPVENELHSPVRFFMRPIDQFKAMERIDAGGLELVGIFHSHPNGPGHPSPTDLAEFFYPGTLALIASRPGKTLEQRGKSGKSDDRVGARGDYQGLVSSSFPRAPTTADGSHEEYEPTSGSGLGLQFCNWIIRGFQIEAPHINEVKLSLFE